MLMKIFIGCSGVLVGAAAAYGLFCMKQSEVEKCWQDYPLTSRELDCQEYSEIRNRMNALSGQLSEAAQAYKDEGKIEEMSVWVRDLTTRQWAAYNEHEAYTPASLLKLPFMLAYYKLAEIDPSILQDKLTYQQIDENDGDVLPSHLLTPGASYTAEEMLEQMIRYSDNNVIRVLVEHLPPEVINGTLSDLGLQVTNQSDTFDFVTAKTYANVFRILYNASYLDRPYSQKALDLLTQSEYKGMAKPLPASVRVAHKFGERELTNDQGAVVGAQLHDCGIVYKEPHPYSLCIMTKGTDFDTLNSVIEEVSKMVYDAI